VLSLNPLPEDDYIFGNKNVMYLARYKYPIYPRVYMKQKTMKIHVHEVGKPELDHVEEFKIHNDNDDMITSCHNYWAREYIPHMIKETDEQLGRDITKSEKLDLMIFKQKLESMLIISTKLGSRKMSFQE
jgi:hypothetical protein